MNANPTITRNSRLAELIAASLLYLAVTLGMARAGKSVPLSREGELLFAGGHFVGTLLLTGGMH
jgi:hypothetical protein